MALNDDDVIKRAIQIIGAYPNFARQLEDLWNTIKKENLMNTLDNEAFASSTIDNTLYSTYEIFRKNFSVGDNIYCSYSYSQFNTYSYYHGYEEHIRIFIKGKISSIDDNNIIIEGSIYKNGDIIEPLYKINTGYFKLSTMKIKKI